MNSRLERALAAALLLSCGLLMGCGEGRKAAPPSLIIPDEINIPPAPPPPPASWPPKLDGHRLAGIPLGAVESLSHMLELAAAYRKAQQGLGRPPKGMKEFRPYASMFGKELFSPRNKQPFNVAWGTDLLEKRDAAAPEVMVIWESVSDAAGKRLVYRVDANASGDVDYVGEESFRAHVKAPPEGAAEAAHLGKPLAEWFELLTGGTEVGNRTVFALVQDGPGGETAVPALVSALQGTDPKSRYRAAYTFRQIGVAAQGEEPSRTGVALRKDAVPALAKALKDEDADVQAEAALALGAFGPGAKPTVGALTDALRSKNPRLPINAAFALGRIGAAAESAVTALSEALAAEDRILRVRALSALGAIGPAAAPSLIRALSNPNGEVRSGAAGGLGRIRPAAREAVAPLGEALRDREEPVRSAAAEALGDLKAVAESAVPALVAALGDPEWVVRVRCAVALGKIGPRAKAAVPALTRVLEDENEHVRSAAAASLAKIAPKG